jgi:flagellar hook-associated protein 3 FlgL
LRIVPSELYTNLLYNLQTDRQNVDQAVLEASSGQSVNNLSDNPIAAGALVLNRAEISSEDQFSYSVGTIQGSLDTAQTALNSVVNSLTQAVSLGTEAAGGTLSSAELQAVAQQVSDIKQQVVGLANTTYQNNYVFAGTAAGTVPFVADAANPSGINYVGNEDQNKVDVGEGQTVTMNLPGANIFGNGTGTDTNDVFQDLTNLATDIQNNNQSAIATDIASVQSDFNNVVAQRTFYGNTLQQLNSDSTNLSQENVTLQQFQSSLISADPAQAATELSQAQATLQASIQAAAEVSQESLLNYLPASSA